MHRIFVIFHISGLAQSALSGLHCPPSSPSRKSGQYCLDHDLESICGWRYLELCFYAPIRFGKSAMGSRRNCDRSTHRMQSRLIIITFSRGQRCTKRILQIPSVIRDTTLPTLLLPCFSSVLATIYEALFMIFGLILSAIMAIGLLVYLVIATRPPQRF